MKTLLLFMLIGLVSFAAFAQDEDPKQIEPPFMPKNPIVVGQGGSFTANAEGYNSFFLNPAGFARKNEFTLTSANPWVYTTMPLINWLLEPDNPLLTAGQSQGAATMQAKSLTQAQEDQLNGYLVDAGIDMDLTQVDWDTIEVPTDVSDVTNIPENATVEDIIVMVSENTLQVDEAALAEAYPDTDFDNMTAEELTDFTETIVADIAGDLIIQVAEQAMDLPPGFVEIGANVGVSLITRGFGLGIFEMVSATFDGDSILSTAGSVETTAAGIIGYAHTFNLRALGLHVGADFRPMYKFKTPFAPSDLIKGMINGQMPSADFLLTAPGFVATAFGVDLGAIVELGPLSVGLAIKDLFNTKYKWQPHNIGAISNGLFLPEGEAISESITPMSINIGASFHPDLGKLAVLIDPVFHVDIRNVAFVKEYYEDFDPLELLNVGAQITVLKILNARAGFNGGYFTGGIGAKLLFLEAHVSAVVDATTFDEIANFGVSAEVTFRF
ncbi:MAG: hypothetical protein CMN78_05110 [Spirochaetales bacterium]|nr:hypothetical protein [Spirochaetales bacterium]